jgi:hypothetical protein
MDLNLLGRLDFTASQAGIVWGGEHGGIGYFILKNSPSLVGLLSVGIQPEVVKRHYSYTRSSLFKTYHYVLICAITGQKGAAVTSRAI